MSGIDRLGAGQFINEVTGQAAFKVDLGGISNFHGLSHSFSLAYFGGGLAESKETPERLKPTSWTGLGFALEAPRIFRSQPRIGLMKDDDYRLEMGGGLSGRLVKYEPNKFVLENNPEIKLERVTYTGQANAVYIVPATPREGPAVGDDDYILTKIKHWILTMPNGMKYRFGDSPSNFTCSNSEFCLPVLRDRIAYQTLYNTDQSRLPVKWYLRQVTDNQAKFSIWFDYDKRKETILGSLIDRMVYPLEAFSTNGTGYPAGNSEKISRVQFITEQREAGQFADGRYFDPLCEIDDRRLKEARFSINDANTHSLSFQYGSTSGGHLRLEKIIKHSLRESVKRPYYTFTYGSGATSWRLATVTDIIGLETHFTYGTTGVTHNQGNTNYPSISTSSALLSTAPLLDNPYISFSRQVGNNLYVCVQNRPANDGPLSLADLYKFENKGNYWELQWMKLLTPVPGGWIPNINALRISMPADGSYILASYQGHPPPTGEQTQTEKTVLLFWDLRESEPASPQIVTTERSSFFSETGPRIAAEIFPFDDWGVLRAGIVNRGFYRNSSGVWTIISVPAPYFNTEVDHDGLMAGPGYFVAYTVPDKYHMTLQTSTKFMIGKIINGQMRTKLFHLMDDALEGPSGGGAWRILGVAPSEHYIAVAFGHMSAITDADPLAPCANDWYADHNYSVAFFPVSELDLQMLPGGGGLPDMPGWTEILSSPANKKYFFLADECNAIPDATQRAACRKTKINPSRFSIQASGNMVVISDPQAMKNVSVYFYDPITNTATAHERIIPGGLDPAHHWPVTAGSNFFTVEKMEVDSYLLEFEYAMRCGNFQERARTYRNLQENYKPLYHSLTRTAGSSHYPHRFDAHMFEVGSSPPYSFANVTPEISSTTGSTSKRLGNISIAGNTFLGIEKVSASGAFSSDGYMLAAKGRSGWIKSLVPISTSNNYFCSPLSSGMACFEYNDAFANGSVRFFDAHKNAFNVGSVDVVTRVTVKSRGAASGAADTRNLDFAYGASSSYSGQSKLPAFGDLTISDDFGSVKRTFKLDPNHAPLTNQNRILAGLEIATQGLPDKTRALTNSAGGTYATREFISRQAAGNFTWPVYSLELPLATSKTHFFASWQEGKTFKADYDPANGQPRVTVARNAQRIMVERQVFQHAPGGALINGDYSKVRQAITYSFTLGEDPCTGPSASPCQTVTASFLDGKKSNAVASVATVFDAVTGSPNQTYQWSPPSLPASIPDFSAGNPQWKPTGEVLRRSTANGVAIVKDDSPTETKVQGVHTLNYYSGKLARPIATVVNSTQLTCALLNGEEQILNPGASWFGAFGEWEKGGSAISTEIVHTGRNSLKVTSFQGPVVNLFPASDNAFWSRKKGLVLSAWIYATGTYQGSDDSQPAIAIEFRRDGINDPIRTDQLITQYRNEYGAFPYNRWVKVEAHITFTDLALIGGSDDHLRIWLGKGGSASANPVYVDDVRIHPVDAAVATSNYDPMGRLTSALDGNNDPTYHEYDVWNRLIGTKDREGRSFSFSSTKLINE